MGEEQKQKPKKKGRWRRRLLVATGVTAVLAGGVWYGIHNIPGFGPALADGARAVFGSGFVAWLEDTAYGIQDRVNLWRHGDEAPTTFWEPPAPSALPPASAPSLSSATLPAASSAPAAPNFPPPAYEIPVPRVAAAGDGMWVPMAEGSRPGEPPVMAKTVVHPDPKRSFAAV